MRIATTHSDVIWNYVGTIVSMASGFVLLPLLMHFLNDEELGLWYVYVAVSNLATLFEFGFNPTFARNIVYVVSGARRLSVKGVDPSSVREGVDWHLLNVIVRASKLVYAGIAVIAIMLLATGGSIYIAYVTDGMDPSVVWPSWMLFLGSVFLSLYFLYSITILRGYGDIAGENQAKTVSRVCQIVVSGIFLTIGWGLVGATIGYLLNALLMRLVAVVKIRGHKDIEAGRKSDGQKVTGAEVMDAFGTVVHVAWRDGVVQLCNYASSQAMSIMASLYLGLAQTGTYSVLLQLATAIYNFASAYPKSFYPAFQSSSVSDDRECQRRIASSSVVAYWGLFAIGTAGVCIVIMPLLPLFKPSVVLDYPLFLGMCAYLGLWNQHGIFCNYIVSMNEIPYMQGFLIASLLGMTLTRVLAGQLGWGAWGIVLGQALSQAVYNNWRWPCYLCPRIGTTYMSLLHQGGTYWVERVRKLIGRNDVCAL